jgi:hypothetical protein
MNNESEQSKPQECCRNKDFHFCLNAECNKVKKEKMSMDRIEYCDP